jgi:beta-fructofuranosidase
MRRLILLGLLGAMVFAAFACRDATTIPNTTGSKGSVNQGELAVFPLQQNGFIGDPMPYFDGTTMNVFYLHDARDGQKGFHPWYLFQTDDYLHWTDLGEAIPYVNNYASQDLALGTGSVIRDKQGLYHAFYTGFNGTGNVDYKEKIQHATSNDLVHWTKHPEHGFYGGTDDFRDPYVLYMESEDLYWMLITTRVNNRGVLKLYKSSDLISWSDHGVFFSNDAGSWNMECPSLIQYNGYWYLSFSEQGNNRIVHYRYKQDLSDAWIRPSVDYFDGIGFYAGRLEVAGQRLLAFGWVGTKQYDYDGGNFDWAGNLVTHELVQQENGTLRVKMVTEVDQALSHPVTYSVVRSHLSSNTEILSFDARSGFQSHLYEALSTNATKWSFQATIGSESGRFGLTFFTGEDTYGPVNIVFNVDRQMLEFYNVIPSRMANTDPQIALPYAMTSGQVLHVKVLIQGQCLTVYVDETIALTTRMYHLTDESFGFFGMKSDVTIDAVRFDE